MKKIYIKDQVAFVDDDDFDKISEHIWKVTPDGYAIRYSKFYSKRMHHDVMGAPPKGSIVHHINGNRLDNRKTNLMVIQQHYHRKMHSSPNNYNQKILGRNPKVHPVSQGEFSRKEKQNDLR